MYCLQSPRFFVGPWNETEWKVTAIYSAVFIWDDTLHESIKSSQLDSTQNKVDSFLEIRGPVLNAVGSCFLKESATTSMMINELTNLVNPLK